MAILEFDAVNAFKRDSLNKLRVLITKDDAQFLHHSLVSAQDEIVSICSAFGEEERQDALRLARKTWAAATGEQSDMSYPGTAGFTEQRYREAAISQGINKLPSTKGAELTRGNLQQELNEAWQQAHGDSAANHY